MDNSHAAAVTLSKTGYLVISRPAFLLMGSPEAVLYAFDAKRQMIALLPATRTARHAYPIYESHGRYKSYRSSAVGFCSHHRIERAVTRKFDATWDGEKLEIRLLAGRPKSYRRKYSPRPAATCGEKKGVSH